MTPLRSTLLLFALAAGGCGEPPAPALDRTGLAEGWAGWVASRDSLFATEASPLFPEDRAAFDGLPYFPYDSALVVPAVLVPTLDGDTVQFPTTTGDLRPMATAGHLVFEADGVEWRLEAFRPLSAMPGVPERLFVPFRDATSGRETYGGGRYLDLDLAPTGRFALDFNRAYNPYCVYNPTYSCPLPPAENTLELAVTAGEQLPEREAD